MVQVPGHRRGTGHTSPLFRVGLITALLWMGLAPGTEAGRGRKHIAPDKRTTGLGSSCQKSAECKGKTQQCLKEMDANGKELKVGFCVLPCLAIDAGLTQVIPGQPIEATAQNVTDAKKAPPPRCPPHYQCRSAGSGVPIDLCIKE